MAEAASAPVVLAPHYYRDNFLRLCTTVEGQYGDLLLPEETDFLRRFRQLEHGAQCLYVRLVSRVGPYFRFSKLVYPEIADLPGALAGLAAAGLVLFPSALDTPALGQLFTVAELRAAFPELSASQRRLGKTDLLAAIGGLALDPAAQLSRLAETPGERVLAPCAVEVVDLLELLFFGNRRQGLTEFVLSDLGVASYYPYLLDRRQRLFVSRAAVDEYLHCAALSDIFYELRELGEWEELHGLATELLAAETVFSSSAGRWNRLCNHVARELERQGEAELALRLYARSELHPARERSARILESGEDWEAALALCRQITADPRCEAERDAAARMMPRLRRKLEGRPQPRRREQFPTAAVALPRPQVTVEQAAAEYLHRDWPAVYYVENTLMNSLFGLAFWEQIFAPVAGVFHNPYQSVPTDMYGPNFRRRRAGDLQRRLRQLQSCDLRAELSDAWRRYHPYQCRWVNWRLVDEDLVAQAACVVPRDHLLAIWERMLFDPGENRRGFPDLLALGERPGRYEMIEVKGPGDVLQDSQKRWLRYFSDRDIPASVLRVEWCDD